MKGIFNLVYKSGPHGDEMTTYTLDIMPNITLEKFVVGVISNELEWGKIRVYYLDKNMENFVLIYYQNYLNQNLNAYLIHLYK